MVTGEAEGLAGREGVCTLGAAISVDAFGQSVLKHLSQKFRVATQGRQRMLRRQQSTVQQTWKNSDFADVLQRENITSDCPSPAL